MTTHPYIPLYIDDFEAATAHLSPEEDGIYNRLLRLCWRTPGCSLPDDPAWIARKVRVSPEDYDRVAAGVLAEFFTLQRGRWAQRRLRREYATITQKKTARKLAGKKGGEAKSRNAKEKPASIATALLPDTCASPEPKPEPDKNYTESARAIDKPFLDGLERELRAAAGTALNVASPSLLVLAPILAMLRPGHGPPCDVEADLLPTIRALAAKARPGSVQTWGYFVGAVTEARDRRLAGAGGSTVPAKAHPQDWAAERWRAAVSIFAESGRWGETCGPEPGAYGCWAPRAVLAEHGYAPQEGGAVIVPFRSEAA